MEARSEIQIKVLSVIQQKFPSGSDHAMIACDLKLHEEVEALLCKIMIIFLRYTWAIMCTCSARALQRVPTITTAYTAKKHMYNHVCLLINVTSVCIVTCVLYIVKAALHHSPPSSCVLTRFTVEHNHYILIAGGRWSLVGLVAVG